MKCYVCFSEYRAGSRLFIHINDAMIVSSGFSFCEHHALEQPDIAEDIEVIIRAQEKKP